MHFNHWLSFGILVFQLLGEVVSLLIQAAVLLTHTNSWGVFCLSWDQNNVSQNQRSNY